MVAREPVRIVHLITSLKVGGAQMHLLRTVSRFSPARIRSAVISLARGGRLARELRQAGIPVYELGLTPRGGNVSGFFSLFGLLRKLRPHLLQTYLYHADLLGFGAARLAGISRVWWNLRQSAMEFAPYRPTTRLAVQLCARLSPRVERILVNSQAGAEAHARLGYDARRMLVVRNGVDTDRFRPEAAWYGEVRRELGLPESARLVGLLGRFDPQKDHGTFLAAAARVAARLPGAYFLLAGDGVSWENPGFARLVSRSSLSPSRVRLLGERTDVPRLLAALDVYVSSSAFGEGFPNAVAEAMACGVPCVVTAVGDSAFLVGASGLVVPPRSPLALAQALERSLSWSETERRQRGAAARERIRAHFDLSRTVATLEELYVQAVASSPPSATRFFQGGEN